MINNEINERIKILAKELKLPYTIRNLAEEINEANLENKSYDSFLCEILEREYELRKENGRKSRIRLAKFPYKRYIEDLILEDLPEDARNKVKIFSTLEFINTGQNIILAGNPGTGNYRKFYVIERFLMNTWLYGESVLKIFR